MISAIYCMLLGDKFTASEYSRVLCPEHQPSISHKLYSCLFETTVKALSCWKSRSYSHLLLPYCPRLPSTLSPNGALSSTTLVEKSVHPLISGDTTPSYGSTWSDAGVSHCSSERAYGDTRRLSAFREGPTFLGLYCCSHGIFFLNGFRAGMLYCAIRCAEMCFNMNYSLSRGWPQHSQ